MTEENSQNFYGLEFKEQLYVFYLEIKGELTKKNFELKKSQLQEIVNSTHPSTILNYIRELFYMLINIKLPPEKEKDELNSSRNKKRNKLNEISQLESHIRKLEYDIRLFLQKEFQNKIKRDTLEMKLNAYMEMETEFEELKEKVKYEGGKFLNNERKDNEIMILRQENSILKKEIQKCKENSDLYESKIKSEQETINELKKQISSLNKKVTKIEKENIKQPNNTNSSINININNNGNSSSKWIIKQDNKEITNINNKNNISSNNNSINPNSNTGSNFSLKKRRINNFTKNYRKYNSNRGNNTTNNYNFQVRSKFNNYEKRGYSGFQTKNHKSHSRGINNVEGNNAFTATYSKIISNLFSKNKTPNKRDKDYKKKNMSNTICIEDYDRTLINNINKSRRFKSNGKNNSYNKMVGIVPNSRFPLSSKHQTNKNNTPLVQKKNLQREKSAGSHSSITINKK
jgi:hypothetical protein